LYVLEADIEGQPKLVLMCVRPPGNKFCGDSQEVGDFMFSVWQDEEKDCISFGDNRTEGWADACYFPESDTWLRENNLFDTEKTRSEW